MLVFLNLVLNTGGQVTHPVQARHAVKVELPQFADNTQQDTHEFLMAILPVLQFPRYWGCVSSVLQCKNCKYQSIKKEVFSCIEVAVPGRGVKSLENCLERWLAADQVQDRKCTSYGQCGNSAKKLVLEVVPELLIIGLKRLRKVENLVEKIYKWVKFPMDKTVIGSNELKGVTYHSGSPMSSLHSSSEVQRKVMEL